MKGDTEATNKKKKRKTPTQTSVPLNGDNTKDKRALMSKLAPDKVVP